MCLIAIPNNFFIDCANVCADFFLFNFFLWLFNKKKNFYVFCMQVIY